MNRSTARGGLKVTASGETAHRGLAALMFPVRCNYCGRIYDLAGVQTTARYADCTVYNTPCCTRSVDDRPWLSLPAFTRLDHDGRPLSR